MSSTGDAAAVPSARTSGGGPISGPANAVRRVWLFNASMALAAVLIWHLLVVAAPVPSATVHIPWWALAILFFIVEISPAVQFATGGSRLWPASEVVFTLGLFFSTSVETLVGWILAVGAAQLVRRREAYRGGFNILLDFLAGAICFAVWQALADPAQLTSARTLLAAFVAGQGIFLTAPLTSAVIVVHSGHFNPAEFRDAMVRGFFLTLVQINVGLVITALVLFDPWLVLLGVLPATAFLYLLRGFHAQREQSLRLRYLHESAHELFSASDRAEASVGLLSRAAAMFHAELAELLLLPRDPGDPSLRTSVVRSGTAAVMHPETTTPVEDAFIELLPHDGALRLLEERRKPRVAAYMRERDLSDGLAAAIRTEERMVGVLLVANHTATAGGFRSDAAALFGTLATQTGASFENTRLQQVSQAKTDYLSRMSHELRTPLASIIGFADLLRLQLRDERDLEYARTVLAAAEHLLGLINDVLDISRIESGREEFDLQPVALAPLVAECAEITVPEATARQVTLTTDVAASVAVTADPGRLRQVLLNLMANAVKYNRDGGSARIVAEPAGADVRISVVDTGPGISRSDHPRLFEPFERLQAGRTRVTGTGLGLTVAKRLVEAMGGRIGVDSEIGTGSTFWIELPGSDVAAALPPSETPAAVEETLGEPRLVLCVEDNAAIRELVKGVVERHAGLRAVMATGGRDGLEMAGRLHPQMVLLDLHLPDIDGDEVLQALKADPDTAAIPVVVLSADATPPQIERLLALGASEYVTKPVRVRDLEATILRRIGTRAATTTHR